MCCPIGSDEPEVELQHLTAEAREDLRSRLSVFRDAQLKKTGESADITLYVGNDIATGFPCSLVDSIACNAEYIHTVSDLGERCTVWHYSDELMSIIDDVLDG